MISQFLQFGYLGLLALLIFLCYRIIDGSNSSGRPLRETLVILYFFSLISLVGGGAGYLWASKELEVARAKESTAVILTQQITEIRQSHIKAIQPLQDALDETTKDLNRSALSASRQGYIKEINQINALIKEREELLAKTIDSLRGVFTQVTE